jgi:hypothetical protein
MTLSPAECNFRVETHSSIPGHREWKSRSSWWWAVRCGQLLVIFVVLQAAAHLWHTFVAVQSHCSEQTPSLARDERGQQCIPMHITHQNFNHQNNVDKTCVLEQTVACYIHQVQ